MQERMAEELAETRAALAILQSTDARGNTDMVRAARLLLQWIRFLG